MVASVRLNEKLCKRSEATPALTPVQRNLILAFLPYVGSPISGARAAELTRDLVSFGLKELEPALGPWKLVWGPGVFQVLPGAIPANTMFVAEHRDTGELFVSIAGTNPFSHYAWFVEDFNVGLLRPWTYADVDEDVAISDGTLKGLLALQGMVPSTGMPGENSSLVRFLAEKMQSAREPIEITVSGHSLGGALSPTLALWLLDTQKSWDPDNRASLSVWAYAGPTPGNGDFAHYLNGRFGDRLHRVANSLDVVPHAWNIGDLANLKALYTPEIARDPLWDKASDVTIAASNGLGYQQIDATPRILQGRVEGELVFAMIPPLLNRVVQVLYQHTLAYFELLDIDYLEDERAFPLRVAGESGAVVSELLQGTGMVTPVSRVLGMGARALAEILVRLPALPSR